MRILAAAVLVIAAMPASAQMVYKCVAYAAWFLQVGQRGNRARITLRPILANQF